jgi:hypothetical protein
MFLTREVLFRLVDISVLNKTSIHFMNHFSYPNRFAGTEVYCLENGVFLLTEGFLFYEIFSETG